MKRYILTICSTMIAFLAWGHFDNDNRIKETLKFLNDSTKTIINDITNRKSLPKDVDISSVSQKLKLALQTAQKVVEDKNVGDTETVKKETESFIKNFYENVIKSTNDQTIFITSDKYYNTLQNYLENEDIKSYMFEKNKDTNYSQLKEKEEIGGETDQSSEEENKDSQKDQEREDKNNRSTLAILALGVAIIALSFSIILNIGARQEIKDLHNAIEDLKVKFKVKLDDIDLKLVQQRNSKDTEKIFLEQQNRVRKGKGNLSPQIVTPQKDNIGNIGNSENPNSSKSDHLENPQQIKKVDEYFNLYATIGKESEYGEFAKVSDEDLGNKPYQLTYKKGQDTARFIINPNMSADFRMSVIQDRSQYLRDIFCETISVGANPQNIITEENGEARFENGKWKVVTRTKIRLT